MIQNFLQYLHFIPKQKSHQNVRQTAKISATDCTAAPNQYLFKNLFIQQAVSHLAKFINLRCVAVISETPKWDDEKIHLVIRCMIGAVSGQFIGDS